VIRRRLAFAGPSTTARRRCDLVFDSSGSVRARAAVLVLARPPLPAAHPSVNRITSVHIRVALPILARAAHCRSGEELERGAVVGV